MLRLLLDLRVRRLEGAPALLDDLRERGELGEVGGGDVLDLVTGSVSKMAAEGHDSHAAYRVGLARWGRRRAALAAGPTASRWIKHAPHGF